MTITGYDPEACLSVPGRLAVGPFTSFTSAFPCGASATALGYATGCTVVKETEYAYALSESRAINKAKTYRGASSAALVFSMIQFDATAYDKVWAYVTTSQGGYTGANTLSLPQPGRTLQPGLVAPSSPVLFYPDNPEHPASVIYAPSWCEEARQKLALLLHKPLESILILVAGLDASGRDIAIGRLEDLVPT